MKMSDSISDVPLNNENNIITNNGTSKKIITTKDIVSILNSKTLSEFFE